MGRMSHHLSSFSAVAARVALTLACAAAATAACTTQSGRALPTARPAVVASTIRTGPGRKKVLAKRPPQLLLAEDGTHCDVGPDVFRHTDVGAFYYCPDWREEPAP